MPRKTEDEKAAAKRAEESRLARESAKAFREFTKHEMLTPNVLSVEEFRALQCRISGMSREETAKAVKMPLAWVEAIEEKEDYIEAYQAEIRASVEEARNILQRATKRAAETLFEALMPHHPIQARLRAAEQLLERAGVRREAMDSTRWEGVVAQIEERRKAYAEEPGDTEELGRGQLGALPDERREEDEDERALEFDEDDDAEPVSVPWSE